VKFFLSFSLFAIEAKEWWVKLDNYVMRHDNKGLCESLDDEAIEYINGRLEERLALKKEKYYDAADEIRDELHEQFGVTIDDRMQEWCVEVDQFSAVDSTRSSKNTNPPIRQEQEPSYSVEENEYNESNNNFAENQTPENGVEISMEVDLENLTVPELKERLKAAGLPVSGRKAELIERLSGSFSSSSPQ
jgi:SAP domain